MGRSKCSSKHECNKYKHRFLIEYSTQLSRALCYLYKGLLYQDIWITQVVLHFQVANIIFLESPACVGYSYNEEDDCSSGDDEVGLFAAYYFLSGGVCGGGVMRQAYSQFLTSCQGVFVVVRVMRQAYTQLIISCQQVFVVAG